MEEDMELYTDPINIKESFASPSYQKVLKRITQLNPNRILLGLTATPTRMQDYDRKRLFDMFNVTVNAENNIGNYEGYIYEVTLKNLLISGFLANPVYKKIETNIAGEIEYLITEEDEAFLIHLENYQKN